MASNFDRADAAGIGVTPTTIYTCPASTTATIIGLSIANITASQVKVTVKVNAIHILKDTPINAGGGSVPVGGAQKMVLKATDIIEVTSDTATSVDATISVLEQT